MGIRDDLKSGKKRLGVWGLGYIGFSSMAHFAKEGVKCFGVDIVQWRVDAVNRGDATTSNLDYWIGFDIKPLAENGVISATNDWEEIVQPDVAVHLVAIPTELDGKPHHDILKDVITKLSKYKTIKTERPPLIIVESTLTPTVVDTLVIPLFKRHGLEVGKDILLGVAPRRDWFTAADKGLTILPRVVGGTTPETTELMAEALGIICRNIIRAPDHKHAAIVKSIENAYRQLDIAFANQLTLAYPDMDMKKILEMVGTKWNVNTYRPSFGTGGYCIPLAPQYVLEGAKHPERLTLLKESLETDFGQPKVVVESLLKRGVKKVAVLGIAYTQDLRVHVLSPILPIIKRLVGAGVEVIVNDPYYPEEELERITGCKTFAFPEGMAGCDTVLLGAGHMKYRFIDYGRILEALGDCRLVIDNSDFTIWKELPFPNHIRYFATGQAHWLEPEQDGKREKPAEVRA